MDIEPTPDSHLERKIGEQVKHPELGLVTKVFEHRDADDDSNFEVNVKLRDSDTERRRIPISMPFNGAASVPEVGDTVVVNFLDGIDENPYVSGYVPNIEDRAPIGKAGIYRLRKGELYFEMDPDGEWVRMAKKAGDEAAPVSKVEIDNSGNVNIEGYKSTHTGSVEITSTGQYVIDDIGFKPSSIEFSGQAVGGQNVDRASGGGSNIANYLGGFDGFARDDGTEQVVHSGGSGDSINQVSQYSSNSECIAIRYADTDGNKLGMLTGTVNSFDSNGFTLDVTNYEQNEVVMYTAYR